MAAGKANVYEMVTARIIAELEKGNIPWEKPWTGTQTGAFNRISKKPYSLINQMLLLHTGEYATFKQWADLGGHVRKGEKSEIVVFWKILEKEETDKDTGEKEIRKIPMLRYYNVFHISQVEGVKPLAKPFEEVKPIEEADRVIADYVKRENINFEECASNQALHRNIRLTVVQNHLQIRIKQLHRLQKTVPVQQKVLRMQQKKWNHGKIHGKMQWIGLNDSRQNITIP